MKKTECRFKRMTISRVGAKRRTAILTQPPYPHVGDEITVKGDPLVWKCVKIEDAPETIEVSFPHAKLNKTGYV